MENYEETRREPGVVLAMPSEPGTTGGIPWELESSARRASDTLRAACEACNRTLFH